MVAPQLRPLRRTSGAVIALLLAWLAHGCDSTEGADVTNASASDGVAAPPLADRFDAARAWSLLERIVALGPRPSGTRKNAEQRNLIASELEAAGLTVVREPFREHTPIGELSFENLYVDLGAAAPEAPMIVLATHFDTKRMPFEFVGANDGGSGTAVLIELARVLADREGEVAWRLLFLDGEEAIQPDWIDPDNRYGSKHHARRLEETGQLGRVKAMVLLDLVGDEDLRFLTDLNSTPALLRILFDAARANGLGDHVYGRQQEVLDDHLSFLAKGIPSADLIDLDFGPGNAYWHSADDTLEHCSQASLGVTGRIVLHAVAELEAWALR
jgi:hypothetical protein